jgi:hypothetical protein
MKSKEYFYKETWKTDKKKFLMLCDKCGIEIKKYSNLLVQEEKKRYICITEIK